MKSLSSFKTPSAVEILNALKTNEGGAWTEQEMLAKFNLSTNDLRTLRKHHLLLSWVDAKLQNNYPKWQFTEDRTLLPGVQEVLRIFKSDDTWRIMRYFLGHRNQLEGFNALFLLRNGQVAKVIAHAKLHLGENTW